MFASPSNVEVPADLIVPYEGLPGGPLLLLKEIFSDYLGLE